MTLDGDLLSAMEGGGVVRTVIWPRRLVISSGRGGEGRDDGPR